METCAALATIRSCKDGVGVVALMARRERTRRRKHRPYVSNHFTQHVAFDIGVIRVLTGALSKVISVVDGIRRAFPRDKKTFRQQIIHFLSEISNLERVFVESNALSNDASEAQ